MQHMIHHPGARGTCMGRHHMIITTRPHRCPLMGSRTARLACRAEAAAAPAAVAAPAAPSTSSPHDQQATSAKIYLRTGWSKGWLHGSVSGGGWKDIPMQMVSSAPGRWLVAEVAAPSGAPSDQALVEFVATDKNNNWIKPEQGNFVVRGPGRYTVTGGAVQAVSGPPVMVVSDLDGTMVGNDAFTAEFKRFWEETGVVRGGVLVYNTGRALDSFQKLLREKAHCMAHPDALISAVGTKVYEFEGGRWEEDKAWSATLDQGWSVEAVREASYKALAEVGKELMHFRPPEEQNDHKVTCGVNIKALDQVLGSIRAGLDAAGVTANIITSGHGEWKYLDLVPIKAGKLEALEYVRKRYGFPLGSTVACGDSGNDILMLAGQNPAIVVGNAQPDLMKWVAEQRGKESNPGRLVVTTKHEALGILEGLETLGLK